MYFFSAPPPPSFFFALVCEICWVQGIVYISCYSLACLAYNFELYFICYEAPTWLGGCRIGVRCGLRRLTPSHLCCVCFFFEFAPTWLWFVPTRLWSGPIRADLTRIELYQPNRIVSTGSRNWLKMPKRPKKAEICLDSCRNSQNRLWMRPKHPKSVLPQFYSEYLLLLLCFLFCFVFLAFFFLCFVNQGHSNVFFKNILIVKIYSK